MIYVSIREKVINKMKMYYKACRHKAEPLIIKTMTAAALAHFFGREPRAAHGPDDECGRIAWQNN
jgi:hypothetical protein